MSEGNANQTHKSESRLIQEKGLEARVSQIVEPVIEDLGFDLVRVRITGTNGCTVQIMAERPDGTMTIEGCETISRALSPVLDVEDPVDREYHLEISSPGIDRPLVRIRDFAVWTGYEIKLELSVGLDGRRRFRGIIEAVEGQDLLLALPDAPSDQPGVVRLPLSDLSEAKLVMTDQLMELALKAQSGKSADEAPSLETDREQ
ncbi:MAG: ribosome maturation factor RimP [Cohaesibacter sp.]|nr:ribosome maturation factor RimP [Cohaesibacter sp.]